LDFAPLDNRHVAAQLGEGAVFVRATRGHCDCGTAIGRAHGRDAKVEALRRSGWSEAKIQRWSEQKAEVAVHEVDEGLLAAMRPDVLYRFEAA
jgi:hypothetical protein